MPESSAERIIYAIESILRSTASTVNELVAAYNMLSNSYNNSEIDEAAFIDLKLQIVNALEQRFTILEVKVLNSEFDTQNINDFILLTRAISVIKFGIEFNFSNTKVDKQWTHDLVGTIKGKITQYHTHQNFLDLRDLAHLLIKLKQLTSTEI